MCLLKDWKDIAATDSNEAINVLVQCAEAVTIPPFSNAKTKCKLSKLLKSKIYAKTLLMENKVINSDIFHIAKKNGSPTHVTIGQNWVCWNLVKKRISVPCIHLLHLTQVSKTKSGWKTNVLHPNEKPYIKQNRGHIRNNNKLIHEISITKLHPRKTMFPTKNLNSSMPL